MSPAAKSETLPCCSETLDQIPPDQDIGSAPQMGRMTRLKPESILPETPSSDPAAQQNAKPWKPTSAELVPETTRQCASDTWVATLFYLYLKPPRKSASNTKMRLYKTYSANR